MDSRCGIDGEDGSFHDKDEDNPGAADLTDNDQYVACTGYGSGSGLADANNAFNLQNRYLMLLNVYHRWNAGSRFAFNRYRHHAIIYVNDAPGKPAIILHSKEGVMQGDVYGSILYGVDMMPLAEKMRAAVPQALQPWFADDSSGTGEAVHVAAVFKSL